MASSLRTAVLGWSAGFLLAMLGSGLANRVSNPWLASGLLHTAVIGAVIVAVLVVVTTLVDLLARRYRGDEDAASGALVARRYRGDEGAASGAPVPPPGGAAAAHPDPASAAARIARLEARLALEEEQLRAAAEALATTDALAAVHDENASRAQALDPAAAGTEPALRQELLDAVSKIIGRDALGSHDLAREAAARLERTG